MLDRNAPVLPVEALEKIRLSYGAHSCRDFGLCAMETVAWLAGQEHTDSPIGVCDVLASFVRRVNDILPTDARNRLLKPVLTRLYGTDDGKSKARAAILKKEHASLFPELHDSPTFLHWHECLRELVAEAYAMPEPAKEAYFAKILQKMLAV